MNGTFIPIRRNIAACHYLIPVVFPAGVGLVVNQSLRFMRLIDLVHDTGDLPCNAASRHAPQSGSIVRLGSFCRCRCCALLCLHGRWSSVGGRQGVCLPFVLLYLLLAGAGYRHGLPPV